MTPCKEAKLIIAFFVWSEGGSSSSPLSMIEMVDNGCNGLKMELIRHDY